MIVTLFLVNNSALFTLFQANIWYKDTLFQVKRKAKKEKKCIVSLKFQ